MNAENSLSFSDETRLLSLKKITRIHYHLWLLLENKKGSVENVDLFLQKVLQEYEQWLMQGNNVDTTEGIQLFAEAFMKKLCEVYDDIKVQARLLKGFSAALPMNKDKSAEEKWHGKKAVFVG